jgi:hexosaminidase
MGPVTEIRYLAHKALGKPISLTFPYSERYSGGWKLALLDGLRGSKSHTDGRWQGFEGDDLMAVIDFGKKQKFSRVTLGCLQNSGSWIFLPAEVEFSVSDNGQDYKVAASQKNDVSPALAEAIIKDFSSSFPITKARYLRIRAKNIGTCPEGHPGAGKKAWLFADEIIVN